MKPLFFSILRGAAVFILSAAFLLLSLCFIAQKTEDPTRYTFIFANIALYISAFLGGKFASYEGNRLFSGLIFGISVTLVLFLITLITSSFNGVSFLRMLITVIFSTLGALTKKVSSARQVSVKKRKTIAKRYGAYR